tara:strand:+ start:397 stop:600 length:204 start_codon:yes stop_codon:yes gene_type:complete
MKQKKVGFSYRSIQTHRVSGYHFNDRIDIPVIFRLTDDGKRVYDVEAMQEMFDKMINLIIKHEKIYE